MCVVAVCNCGGGVKDSYSIIIPYPERTRQHVNLKRFKVCLCVKTSGLSESIPSQGLVRVEDRISTEQTRPISLWQT